VFTANRGACSAASRASNPHPTPLSHPASLPHSSLPHLLPYRSPRDPLPTHGVPVVAPAAPRSHLPSMASPRPLPLRSPSSTPRVYGRISRPRSPLCCLHPRDMEGDRLRCAKSTAGVPLYMEGEPPAPKSMESQPVHPHLSRSTWKARPRQRHSICSMKAGAPLSPALALYMEGVAGAQIDGITACGRRPRSALSPALTLYMEGKVSTPLPLLSCSTWKEVTAPKSTESNCLRTELQPPGSTDSLLRALQVHPSFGDNPTLS
jgi:hypothetical protein